MPIHVAYDLKLLNIFVIVHILIKEKELIGKSKTIIILIKEDQVLKVLLKSIQAKMVSQELPKKIEKII